MSMVKTLKDLVFAIKISAHRTGLICPGPDRHADLEKIHGKFDIKILNRFEGKTREELIDALSFEINNLADR